MGTLTPFEIPWLFSNSHVGLLFAVTVGSNPLRLPDATKIEPSPMVCAEAYQRALASLLPGSLQAWPFKLASVEDLPR